jgi:hypothetical protein
MMNTRIVAYLAAAWLVLTGWLCFQMITVQEARTVMEPVAIQVPQVQTVQAVQMHHKIVEYERPRIVGGR